MISISRAAGTLFTAAALALTLAPAAGATTIASAAHDLTMSTNLPARAAAGGGSGSGGSSGGGHRSSSGGACGGDGHHGGGNQNNSDAVRCDGDCNREHRSRPRPTDPQSKARGCGDPYNYDAGYYGCYQPQD